MANGYRRSISTFVLAQLTHQVAGEYSSWPLELPWRHFRWIVDGEEEPCGNICFLTPQHATSKYTRWGEPDVGKEKRPEKWSDKHVFRTIWGRRENGRRKQKFFPFPPGVNRVLFCLRAQKKGETLVDKMLCTTVKGGKFEIISPTVLNENTNSGWCGKVSTDRLLWA